MWEYTHTHTSLLKNNKGAITLYVTIACLFILIIGIASYVSISNKQAAQMQQLKIMEESYNTGITIEDAYKSYEGGDIIKIRTVEELLKIGSGEQKYIDGKIYTFGKNNTYELENDFEFTGDFREVASRIKENNILINGNDHTIIATTTNGTKEYYTKYSKYYIATNKYGYVLDGLELYYDGIDNTGTGEHSRTATTWKDLSGNGRDGILTNFGTSIISGWGMNYLSFDGINDWVNCGEINNDNVTLDICYMTKSNYLKDRSIIGNWEDGGVGIYLFNNLIGSEFFIDGAYRKNTSSQKQNKNQKLTTTLTYDGNIGINYYNGEKKSRVEYNGKIGKPEGNTVMAIGVNPRGYDGGIPNGGYSDIEVYSCRIYSQGLNEEEVLINNNADERRYKNNKVIPVYTEEQLLKLGSGEEIYIEEENMVYTYSEGKTYELKNNIEIKENYSNIVSKIEEGKVELKLNEYQIKDENYYYTSNSKYTIAVNKYGYVTNGLELYLDGIDNTGSGHSSTTATWKDLSENNRNGTLKNFGTINTGDWGSNGLIFDGVDDYVPIAEMNYENITMEVVVTEGKETSHAQQVFNNIDAGGYTIDIDNKKAFLAVHLGNGYVQISSKYNEVIVENQKYSISASYDGKRIRNRISNFYETKDAIGSIKKPDNNTYIGLGGNMSGNVAEGEYFNGTIHCARLYSRALTDEEQSVNFLNDKERFEL